MVWSKKFGGEVGGELEVDFFDEVGGILILVWDGNFGWDFFVFFLGGVFGGEFDVELFCNLRFDVVIGMGLKVVVFRLWSGLVGFNFKGGFVSWLVCNVFFYIINFG